MAILLRLVAGVLLVAHGLVHLLFIAPDADDPSHAFSLDSSWLLPDAARRPVAYVLMAAVVAAFGASALALWGVSGLAVAWPWITIVAAGLSLVLPHRVLGREAVHRVIISLVLIALAVTRPRWITTIGA